MKKTIIFSFFCIVFGLSAQSAIDRLVNQIERNSPVLAVLRHHLEADKTGTKTGLYPDNPELDLGFLNGKPDSLGRKTNFSIRQTLDFPLAYLHRGRLAMNQSELLDHEYHLQKRDFLLDVRLLAIDLVHANALVRLQENHLQVIRELADAYKASFESGEANILEYNKARITLLEVEKELERTLIHQGSLLADLTRLNGGQPVEFSESRFNARPLPDDFLIWYEGIESGIIELRILKNRGEGLDTQVNLDRALYLPRISLGYMSEAVEGEKFSGFTAGFSIPLFEGKNRVTAARKRVEANRFIEDKEKKQLRAVLKNLYEESAALNRAVTDYRSRLVEYDSTPLLKKALEQGEISIIEYVNEISAFFDNQVRQLQMEQELNKTLARFFSYGSR